MLALALLVYRFNTSEEKVGKNMRAHSEHKWKKM